jgi:putative ABC transport system permease protein
MEPDPVTAAGVAELTSAGVLVRERVAADEGWQVGDMLAMQFQAIGERPAMIQGFFDWHGTQADYLIALGASEGDFVEQLDDSVLVKGAPWASAGMVRAAVDRAVAGFPNAKVMDRAEFQASQAKQVDGLLVFVQALLGLSIVIALLGIANTLAMSIFERTHELGLLRAVGMSPRQLRSMVRWEAVIIGVIGALFGTGVGVFFGWALVRAMADQGVTEFALPYARLALYILVAAGAGIAAAWFPARRAAKLNILGAIASE